MNARLFVPVALLLLGPGCRSPSLAEIEAATLYFPPQVKYIGEPRFSFSSAERARALREYKERGADTLFEILIDPKGKVARSRLIRTHVDDVYRGDLEHHARFFEFSEDLETQMYRAFYFPVRYRYASAFEWL